MLLMMMASCGVVWLGLVMCVRECDGILKWIAALLITNSYNELHKSFVIKFQFIEYKYDLYTAFFYGAVASMKMGSCRLQALQL